MSGVPDNKITEEKKYKINHFDLEKCLAFECEDIPDRLRKSMYELSEEEAQNWWMEGKKWIWLLAESHMDAKEHPHLSLFIDSSTFWLDEIWHNFVLFTREYHKFCQDNFGFYVHHAPATKKDKEERKERADLGEEDMAKMKEETQKTLEILYEYIYDKLGEDTLLKWYDEYAEKYSREELGKICLAYKSGNDHD